MSPASGRGDVMVPDQQQDGDFRLAEAHDPFSPFSLIGGSRVLVLVGVASKEHAIHFFADGGIDDFIQRIQEIMHPQRQPTGRVATTIGSNIDMSISKVEDSRHFIG